MAGPVRGVERTFLIIDQPEDDLDNRFIYEDIVQILRNAKGKRQIIVATHNPNIPVLGDAELIVAMDVHEGKARISAQGAVDRLEVRDAVKRIMEGGEDAFKRRAEKYGWFIEDRPGPLQSTSNINMKPRSMSPELDALR